MSQSTRKLFDPNRDQKKKIVSTSEDKTKDVKQLYQQMVKEEKRLQGLDFDNRRKLSKLYDVAIQFDSKAALKHDLEGRKWKFCVYQLISENRKGLKEGQPTQPLNAWFSYLIEMLDCFQVVPMSDLPPSVWAKGYLRQGDIYRYLAVLIVQEKDRQEYWDKARYCYTEYSKLVPTNGLIWNQLALCESVNKCYLNSLKNYFHSLTVPKPFENAREAVLETFHLASNMTASNADAAKMPHSMVFSCVTESALLETERVFLSIQEILYTKIGLDHFQHRLGELTTCLQNLGGFYKLDRKQQVQWWFTVGFVSITNATIALNSTTFDEAAKKVIMSKSFDTIFIILTFGLLGPDLAPFEIFIELVLVWILHRGSLEPFKKDFEVAWELLQGKYNKMALVYQSDEDALCEVKKRGICPEDALFKSCTPFMALASDQDVDDVWKLYFDDLEIRKQRIECLLGYVLAKRSIQQVTNQLQQTSIKRVVECSFSDFDEEEAIPVASTLEQDFSDVEESDDVRMLKARKEQLQTSYQRIEQKSVLRKGITVLVFDTNLIVRSFHVIRRIIESREWKIVFPLTVVMELIGLKDTKEAFVASSAATVCQYIQENLGRSLFSVRTAKGNTITLLGNTVEEWSKDIRTPDDAILATCQTIPHVCFVTTDRNIRIKATSMGIFTIDSLSKIQ